MGRECCQDAQRTKTWVGIMKLFRLGSHLQATAVECMVSLVTRCRGIVNLQVISQGGAELVGGSGQDDWRTKAWRSLEEFFRLGSHPQATAVEPALQERVLPPEAVQVIPRSAREVPAQMRFFHLTRVQDLPPLRAPALLG